MSPPQERRRLTLTKKCQSNQASAALLMMTLLVVGSTFFPEAKGVTLPSAVVVYSEELGMGDWLAVRANLTPGSDLVVDARFSSCRDLNNTYTSTTFTWIFTVRDGAVETPTGMGMDGTSGDSYEANLDGTRIQQSPGPEASIVRQAHCSSSPFPVSPRGEKTFVVVYLSGEPISWVNGSMNWTMGVQSYDIIRGHGALLGSNQFDNGAHANVYPSFFPTYVAASAHMSAAINVQHDTFGFFVPPPGVSAASYSPDAGVWSCHQDGGACRPQRSVAPEVVWLQVKGAHNWEFEITAQAGLEGPHFVVVAVEFPDDTYLNADAPDPWR